MACQVSTGCFICAQHPVVYAACVVQSSVVGSWKKLPGVTRWGLVDNVTEGDEILTSDTAGKLVKACPDTVAWSLEIDAALCDANCDGWIYNHVLAGNATNLANPKCLAYWATWKGDQVPTYVGPVGGMEAQMFNGIAVVGDISPRGFEVDGGSPSSPVTTQLVVNVISGPYLPNRDIWLNCTDSCESASEPYAYIYPGVWPDDYGAGYSTSPPNAPTLGAGDAGDDYQVTFQDGTVAVWNWNGTSWDAATTTDGRAQLYFGTVPT